MPILAMDQNGRIYQTSGDREDGLGFGSYPEPACQRDVTLGNAYLKSQARQRDENLRRKRAQAIFDEQERLKAYQHRRKVEAKRAYEARKDAVLGNYDVQTEMIKRGLGMCCDNGHVASMSGNGRPTNGLTANGQRGWNGMSRDQQAIHHVLTGMGRNNIPKADPVLERQHQMRTAVDRMLKLTATPVGRSPKTRL